MSKMLWELQCLEERKFKIEKELKNIPEFRELKMLKSNIETCQSTILALKEDLRLNKRELKQIEDTISEFKIQVERANDELYSGEINNVKEMEAIEKNICAVKERIAKGEDRAIKLMENLENNESKLNSLLQELEEKKTTFRKMNKMYNEKKLGLASELEQNSNQQEILLSRISPESLKLYQNICRKFEDKKGVVLLEKDMCSGCHMAVSFDLLKQAKSRNEGIMCDNCGRLLIIE